MILPDLQPLAVPVDKLTPLPGNPRVGDVDAVARSYAMFGQRKPIVARHEGDGGIVIAGNHQLAAARQLGWDEIAVVWVDDDDITAKAFALADNRTADLGTYDDEALLEMLQAVHDSDLELYAATAYEDDFLASLASEQTVPGRDTDAGELPAEPVTRPGDLILLGEHRLLCGDSTDALAVERLMAGFFADCMWTDPPYGVNYVGKTKDALTIKNDGKDDLEQLLRGAFAMADTALARGAAIYIAHPAGALSVTFGRVFLDMDWRLHETLIWVKDSMVLGHSDYHYKHEPILYGYTRTDGRTGRGAEGWYGDNSQTTVLEFDRPKASPDHPTSKPVDLIEHCLGNSTTQGHLVYEPFGGSGSTLVACENLNRRCYAMELDPRYCDVIVDRWERHTGQSAERHTP